MGIADELWAKLFLNPLCSVKATYNSQGKGLWQKLTAASGTFRLSRVIQPLFANVRPDPNDENNIQEIELVALDGGRVYNGGELNYGLMVKAYPSEVCTTDGLSVSTTGGSDSTVIASTHIARVYGVHLAWDTDGSYNFTDGSVNVTIGSKILAKMDVTKASLNGSVWVSCPIPVTGQLGDDITLNGPTFDAGACKVRATPWYVDIIGDPLTT